MKIYTKNKFNELEDGIWYLTQSKGKCGKLMRKGKDIDTVTNENCPLSDVFFNNRKTHSDGSSYLDDVLSYDESGIDEDYYLYGVPNEDELELVFKRDSEI